jgi:hypothetical protein
MSYLARKVPKDKLASEAAAKRPFGPGFNEAEISCAESMEIWCSSATDGGSDWAEFRLLDSSGRRIATVVVEGY